MKARFDERLQLVITAGPKFIFLYIFTFVIVSYIATQTCDALFYPHTIRTQVVFELLVVKSFVFAAFALPVINTPNQSSLKQSVYLLDCMKTGPRKLQCNQRKNQGSTEISACDSRTQVEGGVWHGLKSLMNMVGNLFLMPCSEGSRIQVSTSTTS